MYLNSMGEDGLEFTNVAQNKEKWQAFAHTVMNRVLHRRLETS
jgi:hypothetical protein